MEYEDTFIEIECFQRTKTGESACGDDFKSLRIEQEGRSLSVLSDGLGSGIKASLLATMTTTMALEFFQRNMDIVQSGEIIMDCLPVCEVRRISYATFTVADILANGRVRMIEMDNPRFIHLRNGKDLSWPNQTLVAENWPERKMNVSEFKAVTGDRIIFCSDGVTQAGLGRKECKFGWRRAGLLEFVQEKVEKSPNISARELAQMVVSQACMKNENYRCVDDTSCTVIYFRKPRRLRLLTGPPFRQEHDKLFAEKVVGFDGKTIVSGGTTANILSRELNRKITCDLKQFHPGAPPMSKMDGIDLVTEGILTLTEVARALEGTLDEKSAPAVKGIYNLFMDCDAIEMIVGTKVNEAHQDPSLPVDLEIRRNIIKRLAALLEEKYLKRVTIKYF